MFGESSVLSSVSPLAEKGAEPTFKQYHSTLPGQSGASKQMLPRTFRRLPAQLAQATSLIRVSLALAMCTSIVHGSETRQQGVAAVDRLY